MMKKVNIATGKRSEFIDITGGVRQIVANSQVKEGLCLVFVPHTTAAVTINENADPSVRQDIGGYLERIVPHSGGYRHLEGNSDAHIKASLLGFSVSVLVEGNDLALGTWQGIYFAEFDGPRSRSYFVKVLSDA